MNLGLRYAAANLAFALLVIGGVIIHTSRGVHPIYLLLLFALCSSPLLHMRRLNDKYALLALFSLVYFQFYGVVDFLNLLLGTATLDAPDGALTQSELLILVGIALAQISYRLACRGAAQLNTEVHRDWSQQASVIVGLALFFGCTWINWINRVEIFANIDTLTAKKILASMNSFVVLIFMLAAMALPLGILILAYAQRRFRSKYLTPLIVFVVIAQAAFGFIVDVKGDVLLGGVLVLLAMLLVEGRIPRGWLVSMIAFVLIAFPALQANRVLRGNSGVRDLQIAQNLGEAISKAWEARNKVKTGIERTETFYERLSLKSSVDLIVAKTGTTVPYQFGHTLAPLIGVFIPRIIWPSKPDVPTGQVMNKEFHVTEVPDTYISPSHLGELYWNFGWPGAVIGMTGIGLLLGFIGRRFDLTDSATLTRVLVVAVTMKMLVLGAEGAIAPQYATWFRSMLAIGILHLLMAHRRVLANQERSNIQPSGPLGLASPSQAPFPNLMR